MTALLVVLLICFFTADIVSAQSARSAALAPLGERLYEQIAHKTLTSFDAPNSPGGKLLLKALERTECSAAIGGHFGNAAERFRQTQHFASPGWVIPAEERPVGSSILYALALNTADTHRVLLFPSFFSPQSVLRRLLAGGADRVNSLPDFERAVGLKAGALTVELFQAIALGHEQMHVNESAIEDIPCPGLSCLNTMRVVKSCFPELLNPESDQSTLVSARFIVEPPENCVECHFEHKSEPVVVPSRRTKGIATLKARSATGRSRAGE
ncbi:MAG TPA: hypothetical protein VN519_10135 [Bryobacteraceae bacterium]|nr:hypothetical protein [Bryobacteraceae bacterium]